MNTDYARVEQAVEALGEHFDTVQIFVTRHEPSEGGTITINSGAGNWHARHGQVRAWVVRMDSEICAEGESGI